MRYIHALEEKKFLKEKEEENKILRKLGVSEKIIQELFDYDKEMFLENRRYNENEKFLEEEKYKKISHTNIPYVSLITFDREPLEGIEDIKYALLGRCTQQEINELDIFLLEIILLKIKGYKYKEISQITGLSVSQIKYAVKLFKEKIK